MSFTLSVVGFKLLVVTLCLVISVILGVGSAYSGRSRVFRYFFYNGGGWAVSAIILVSIFYTVVTFTGGQLTGSGGTIVCLVIYFVLAVLLEVVMLVGALMLLLGVRMDEEGILVPPGVPLDRFLKFLFRNGNPYAGRWGKRSICGMSWLLTLHLMWFCVVAAVMVVVSVASIVFAGYIVDLRECPRDGRFERIVGFTPILVFLEASIFAAIAAAIAWYTYHLSIWIVAYIGTGVLLAFFAAFALWENQAREMRKKAGGKVVIVAGVVSAVGRRSYEMPGEEAISGILGRFWNGLMRGFLRIGDTIADGWNLLSDLKERACPVLIHQPRFPTKWGAGDLSVFLYAPDKEDLSRLASKLLGGETRVVGSLISSPGAQVEQTVNGFRIKDRSNHVFELSYGDVIAIHAGFRGIEGKILWQNSELVMEYRGDVVVDLVPRDGHSLEEYITPESTGAGVTLAGRSLHIPAGQVVLSREEPRVYYHYGSSYWLDNYRAAAIYAWSEEGSYLLWKSPVNFVVDYPGDYTVHFFPHGDMTVERILRDAPEGITATGETVEISDGYVIAFPSTLRFHDREGRSFEVGIEYVSAIYPGLGNLECEAVWYNPDFDEHN